MTSRSLAVICFLILSGCVQFAWGSAQRTFVSASGLDTNPCTVTQPCRNFAAAIAQTLNDGEVIVLSSGGYGSFSISSLSVSVIAPPGVYAGVTSFSGHAIDVTLAAARHVTLRGLTINGLGGFYGVYVDGSGAGATVTLSRVVISGFVNTGFIGFAPATYDFEDSEFRKNPTDGLDIEINAAGTYVATASHCLFAGNGDGFLILGPVRATVADSISTNNTGAGFWSDGSGSFADLRLERCVSTFNTNGVRAGAGTSTVSRSTLDFNTTGARSEAGGVLRLGDTWITNNGTGVLAVGGGQVLTLGNNVVELNGTNGTWSGSFTPQ
jgi:parallel beta helix pectate lyase-like protein